MKLLLLLLLLSPTYLFAQTDTTQFAFTLIDSIQESKEQLFVKAKSWFANAFNSSKDVVQMEDRESGKIIGKGLVNYDVKDELYTIHMNVKFTMTVNVKENKYRIILSNFINDGYLDDNPTKRINGSGLDFGDKRFTALPYSSDVKPELVKRANELLLSFKNAMVKRENDIF